MVLRMCEQLPRSHAGFQTDEKRGGSRIFFFFFCPGTVDQEIIETEAETEWD